VAFFKSEEDPPRLTPSPSQASLAQQQQQQQQQQAPGKGAGSRKGEVVVEAAEEEGGTWASVAAAYKALWGVVSGKARVPLGAASSLLAASTLHVACCDSWAVLHDNTGVAGRSSMLARGPVTHPPGPWDPPCVYSK
jgi:hypothetical protein